MRKDLRDVSTVEAVLLILGCGVFIVWAVTQLASVFFDKPVDPAVHGIMLGVVTGLFTLANIASRRAQGNGTNGRGGG